MQLVREKTPATALSHDPPRRPLVMPNPSSLVVLTGAGISAESGLPTFRDANGLWEGHRFEEVATPEAFASDPTLVHRFYNLRRAALPSVQPNAAHLALAQLEKEWSGPFLLVTQNVDDLHERAGSQAMRHMHGELRKIRCEGCAGVTSWETDLSADTPCPTCGKKGHLRPDIVWFGEMPFFMDEIQQALRTADLFISIGTSGVVYPAAGFVELARKSGAKRRIEVNLDATDVSGRFNEHRIGPASIEVPKLVNELLSESAFSR